MSLSLKIPTATLITKVQAARTKVIEDHKAAVAANKENVVNVREQLIELLEAQLVRISDGGRLPNPESYYAGNGRGYRVSVKVSVEVPKKVDPKPDTTKIDRDLALLQATSQETLTLRSDADLARYL